MFTINRNKGFQVTFENGWTVSVQFGPGNYCQRRSDHSGDYVDYNAPQGQEHWESTTAEIAAWKDGKWHNFGTDTVDGWVRPAEVLEFMTEIASKD